MLESMSEHQSNLGDAIGTLEVVRDMLSSSDPETRAYAVSVSIAIHDVLSSIYSAEMDIRFNKERACRF